jgi:hypothetical protein
METSGFSETSVINVPVCTEEVKITGTVNMEAWCSFESFVTLFQSARRHVGIFFTFLYTLFPYVSYLT